MGVFKKFRPCVATELFQLQNSLTSPSTYPTISYKMLDGTSFNNIFINNYAAFSCISPYSTIVPVATADELINYSFDDYQIIPLGTTSYGTSISVNQYGGNKNFSISIVNNTDTEITIKCIKFKKQLSTSSENGTTKEALVCAYYLDEDEYVTIAPGLTGTVSVVLNIYYDGQN